MHPPAVYSLTSQEASLVREQSTQQLGSPCQQRDGKPFAEVHGRALCKIAFIWKQLMLFYAALAAVKAASYTKTMSMGGCSITADATAWHPHFGRQYSGIRRCYLSILVLGCTAHELASNHKHDTPIVSPITACFAIVVSCDGLVPVSQDCGCQQAAQSNLSPAPGAGGIGRGGTPIVGSYTQGEAPASSPAPFSGFGPTAGSQMTITPGTGMSAAAFLGFDNAQ